VTLCVVDMQTSVGSNVPVGSDVPVGQDVPVGSDVPVGQDVATRTWRPGRGDQDVGHTSGPVSCVFAREPSKP